jgi:imidazolonepropionase-like amidohydrolase
MIRPLAAAAFLMMASAFGGMPATAQQGPGAKPSSITIIHAGAVLRDAAGALSGPATITVADGRIVSIVDGIQPAPGGAEVVELSDKTVLPGLIDLHVHLTMNADELADWHLSAVTTDEWMTASALANGRRTLRAGFTTVRDLFGKAEALAAARRAIGEGSLPGPRILMAGNALSAIGGHGDFGHGFRPDVRKAVEKTTANSCTGAAECAALVRRTVRDGADWIKFMATGGVMSQGDKSLGQQFTDEEMKAIVDTAHSLGVKVAAHAHSDSGIAAAVRAGTDTIEHGTFLSPETARLMKQRGTVLVPTLLPFKFVVAALGKGIYSPTVEAKIREVGKHIGAGCRSARSAGVTVAFGTDAGVFDHGHNGEEFALLVEHCGFTPRDALAIATTGAAKVIGMEGQIGRIAPGYSADMIAVKGNPIEDATRLEHVDWVMVQGRLAN